MENQYVLQDFYKYNSFEHFIAVKKDELQRFRIKPERFDFEQLFSSKGAFIIGEPGYGKTRLLKEIVIRAGQKGKPAFFIDAKKIKRGALSETIKRCKPLSDFNLSENELQNEFLFSNASSSATAGNCIICIDALDEVAFSQLFKLLEMIYEFQSEEKHIVLFLSCRTHHLKKINRDFAIDRFSLLFFKLGAFDFEQVDQYTVDPKKRTMC